MNKKSTYSGIVLDNDPYIVVVLTNEGNNNYKKIISEISKLIYDYHHYK